jgi:hypothetical protein
LKVGRQEEVFNEPTNELGVVNRHSCIKKIVCTNKILLMFRFRRFIDNCGKVTQNFYRWIKLGNMIN